MLLASSCYADLECVPGSQHSWNCDFYRKNVPHGWLVTTGRNSQSGVTFYPDEKHEWKL